MINSAMITECWTPQSSHRDTFFSIYLVVPVSLINLDLNSRNNTRYNSLPIPFTRYNPYFHSFYPSTLRLLFKLVKYF